MARLPDFLIIGAMKAGTTTLYHDLLTNPNVYMPSNKEPQNLLYDHVLTPDGRNEYGDLFHKARPTQLCGEATTEYSKLPRFLGVPERAKALLGPQLRVVYIVRNPVLRIMSQHYHQLRRGDRISRDIAKAVQADSSLLDYSRYAMQLRPWIDTFGRDAIHIVQFESYVQDRATTIRSLCNFLGVAPELTAIREDVAFNRGVASPINPGLWKRLRETRCYQHFIRYRIPAGVRAKLRTLLFPKLPDRPASPDVEAVAYIVGQLAIDMEELRDLMGLSARLWDFEQFGVDNTTSAANANG